MEDFIPNTHPVLANLNTKVLNLENEVSVLEAKLVSMTSSNNTLARTIAKYKESVLEYITREYTLGNLDQDVCEEIANRLDISPTKTVDFHGTITFSGSIEIGLFEDEYTAVEIITADNLRLDGSSFGEPDVNDFEVESVQIDSVS